MSRIARISGGVKATLRNLPSMFFNEQSRVSSTHLLVGLPTNSNWVKKSNFWNLASSFFFNPNGITKQLPLFLPSLLPFITNGKDDKVENAQFDYLHKEKVKIVKVLLDYDEPENHLVDGMRVLMKVLEVWEMFRPNYELDYGVDDLEDPEFLSLITPLLNVDEEATRKKIIAAERAIVKLLLGYDDTKFADQVLFEAIEVWKRLIWEVETDCIEVWTTDKDEHDGEVIFPFPADVIDGVRDFKSFMYDFNDPNYELKKMCFC